MAPSLPLIGLIAALLPSDPGFANALGTPAADVTPPARRAQLSPEQMLALADAAGRRGDIAIAEAAYRALATNPDLQMRTEARFRLGTMFAALKRPSEAAILFRKILDEQPGAQRVRLELARMLDLLGDETGARRALREAQAGGLPSAVARFVDRYSAALRAQKPFGFAVELALAPDSNINRATRSDTLGTVFGDFTLDDDARQKSGIGAAIGGQAYTRTRLGESVNLLARVSGKADLYRRGEYNDVALSIAAGPEIRFGDNRLSAEASRTWRRFGGIAYSTTTMIAVNYARPLDRRSQLRAAASFGAIDNRRNRLQDGRGYTASLSYERALSSVMGAGVTLAGDRQLLRDAGYSTTAGQISLFAYRDVGAATLIGSLGYGRLEADERLFIYPKRRKDTLFRASLGATFRQLTIGDFAPLVRVTAERNRSSIEVFDYRRLRTEFGLARAF